MKSKNRSRSASALYVISTVATDEDLTAGAAVRDDAHQELTEAIVELPDVSKHAHIQRLAGHSSDGVKN